MDKVHACYSKGHGWRCEACDFSGTLKDAVAHAVKNQFVVP